MTIPLPNAPASNRLENTPGLWTRIAQMSPEQRQSLLLQARPRIVDPYVPHVPHPTQQVFLSLNTEREVFFGGATGGGKSDALLMAALQFVDVPGYSALILRKTFKELTEPGAIMDRANDWLSGTPAKRRNGGMLWEFPTGPGLQPATLSFGHLLYHSSVEQYRGSEFVFIAWDELTEFEERTYEFMFSRLRRPALPCANCPRQVDKIPGKGTWRHKEIAGRVRPCDHPVPKASALKEYPPSRTDGVTTLFDVPLRVRSASNPGGLGHAWVRDRFVDQRTRKPGCRFVPSKMTDNPNLDQESYRESLSHMGTRVRLALEEGMWDVPNEDAMLKGEWFDVVEDYPREKISYCRYWDLAATAPAKGKAPDWTVGALLGVCEGIWYLIDLRRTQARPADVERLVLATAQQDMDRTGGVMGRVRIRMEQEPGSSGVITIATFRKLLLGFDFDGDRPGGSKEERARPLAVSAENHNFKIVRAPWNRVFLDEAESFPEGPHDDQIDAVTGAMKTLAPARKARLVV